MVGNKLNKSQQCSLAAMKANSTLCCINRSTVRGLGKIIIPLCLVLVRRYVVPFLQFCHPSTRDMTCKQARQGPVARLGACSTWGKAEGTGGFSLEKTRLRVKANCNLPQPKEWLQKRQNQVLLRDAMVTSPSKRKKFHHQSGKHQDRCPERLWKLHPQRFSKYH